MQLFNYSLGSKLVSQKSGLAGVVLFPGTNIRFGDSIAQDLPLDVNGLIVNDWKEQFPEIFEEGGTYGTYLFIPPFE